MSTEATELVAIETLKAADLFAEGGAAALVAGIEATVRAIETDISTPKARAAVASLAMRVAKAKVKLDDLGKAYNADLKKQAKVVDDERKVIRERLDALRDEVRKPLDEFEAKQQARIDEHTAELAKLEAGAAFEVQEPSVSDLMDRILKIKALGANRDWEEFAKRADKAREEALSKLAVMLEAATRREEERAELERLRAENAAREEREKIAQAAQAAADKAKLEAAAETARVEQEKRDAIARAEKAEKDKATAEAAAQTAAAEATERERKRIAEEQAEADRERERREANKRHRGRIHTAIKGALMQHAGLSEDHAKAAVAAIAKGDVPNITINY